MRNREIVTCSSLNFLNISLQSLKVSLIKKSLLWMLLFQCFCYFVRRNILFLHFKSVYGILNLSMAELKADFPLTLMWLDIHQIRISLESNMESKLFSSLMIKGSSSFIIFSDIKTESETENIIKILWLLSKMMSSTMFIAWSLAEKMELSFRRVFPMIFLFKWLRTLFYRCPWSHQ